MKVLIYYEAVYLSIKIKNKGRVEQASYDIRKKAKMGGYFNSEFSANCRVENQAK